MVSVHKELAAVAAEVKAVNAAMLDAAKTPSGVGRNTTFLKDYAKKVDEVSSAFRSAVAAQGDFGIRSMKVASQADRLTEMIQRQKFGIGDLAREHKNLNEVYKQQMSLHRSMVMQWGRDSSGMIQADLLTPRTTEMATRGFKDLRREAGFYNQVLASVADQTVKWGKNTQWAGRQLMAGLSMPIAAAAAGTGVLAYQLDKGLTQVVKVYGDAATAATTTDQEIKDATMSTAKTLASAYGQSAKDSIEITSQLAAAGKTGNELQESTAQVTRARTLGELDLQDAMKATITLQSVYNMNSQKLGETFDFMNSMENQTNLTMQDFVVGIPKTVGVLKEFGGSVQDAGILLAGMKAAGIDAAEGANAIKSIAFKVISPNQGSKDLFQQLTGKSFDQTMAGVNGVVDRLTVLGQTIQGLSDEQRVGLIQKMFGLYQGSKTLSLLDQLTSGSEQMTRAFEVASGGAAQWADTAQRELNKLQTSGWNKIKQQWESLKIELAEVGQTFLEMGAPILKAVSDVITKFNDLDPAVKKFILFGTVAVAALGPIIMLAGLFGNLIGNVGKLTTFLVGLGLKFKIVTDEQVIASRLANTFADNTFKEAEAVKVLTTQLTTATTALRTFNMAQIGQQYAAQRTVFQSSTGTPVVRTRTGGVRPAGAKEKAAQLSRDYDEATALNKAMPASAVVAANSDKTRKSWKEISGSSKAFAVAGVAGAVSMVAPTSSTLSNVANIALIGGSVAPVLGLAVKRISLLNQQMIYAGAKGSTVIGKMVGWIGKATSKAGGLVSRFTAFLPALAPIAPALIGIGATAGAAFYVMNKNIAKTREESQQFANSAKDYADLLGFAYSEAAKGAKKAGDSTLNLDAKVSKLIETNKGAAKEFQWMSENSNDEQRMSRAIQEALKARLHGASAEQGYEAGAIALRAMGSKLKESELVAKIKTEIDLTDMKQVINRQIRTIQGIIDEAIKNNYRQGKSEGIARFFLGDNDINTAGAEAIRASARDMWDIFANSSEDEQISVFNRMRLDAMSGEINMFDQLAKAHSDAFKKYNIKNANDLARYTAAGGDMGAMGLGFNMDEINNWKKAMDSVRLIIEEFGKKANLSDEQIKKMLDFSQIADEIPYMKEATSKLQDVSKAQKQYETWLSASAAAGVKLSDAEKLERLNLLRRSAGLPNATSLQQGFTDAIIETTQASYDAADAHKALAEAMSGPTGIGDMGARLELNNPDNVGTMVNSMKDAYSGAMDTVYENAARIMDEQNNAVIDGIQARGDAASAALDRQQDKMEAKFDAQNEAFQERWDKRKKSIENVYDTQIDKVQQAIDAEQKADDLRQKMFEAEKTRIERLSDMYNRNIDINAAIAGGKLDDAAKLQNDANATQQGWLIDDAAAAAGDASKARVDSLNKQKDAISDAKDRALDLADTQEKAEQKALKATQDAEKKKLDARKKALDISVKNEIDGAKRKQEANKRALDVELAQLKAFIPQNESQLKTHIGRVEKAYKEYGGELKKQGTGWGNIVGGALQNATKTATIKMSSDIAWGALGKVAADKMAEGAFNMNLTEFMKWVMTGEAPKNYQAPSTKLTSNDIQRITGGDKKLISDLRHQGLHSGGIVGQSNGSRTGFSGKRQSQSEVTINALKGEAVLNRSATRNLGTDFVEMANKGMLPKNIGGPDLMSGMGGLMGALMAGALRKSISAGILTRGTIRKQVESGAAGMDYTAVTGKAGRYGDSVFSAEQLRNAGIIASTGKSMGASNRDIIIALMTAMQESTLRNLNYGDRDSLGLFQQRAAWGSAAERTNPVAAARMFFGGGHQGQRGLFDFANRGKMTLGQAAQAVQVSAFPGAYDKWADEAAAIFNSLKFSSTGGFAGVAGMGGWVRPASGPRTSPYGMRVNPVTGVYKLHAGSDIGAPSGAAIHAAKNGRVVSTSSPAQSGGYGNYTVIDHGNGISTAYAHQSRFAVHPGQTVKAGQTIGYVGSTGNSTGPHLHFEYIKNGQRLNPNQIIPGLDTGGFTMSDGLAMLHKNETVLTAPLSESLKQGINNMDKSQHFGYNVSMNFAGAKFNNEIDFEKSVVNALLAIEKRRGPSRRIG